MIKNKEKMYKTIMAAAVLVCLVLSQCAGPIYFNKELKTNIEPVVYLVPSSYFGTFLVALNKPEETWKTIPFGNWESFDIEINKTFRNSFKEHNVEMILLKDDQVCEGFKIMIASDTIKDNYLQYLTLKDICGNIYDSCMLGIKPGLLMVCTKLQLKRSFPSIKASANFYVYAVADGGLMFVNKIAKDYVMSGIIVDAFVNDPNYRENLENRFYGLQTDEKDAYLNISKLIIGKLVADVARRCLGK